ncbi:MAG: GxxExxY protein [Bacteroidetes bacterium]|nr:GxxExxY protein [Bacteroidota bacterium]
MVATDSQIKRFDNITYPIQEETYQIIGICMEIHRILGKGLLEIVYKDALEYETKSRNIPYEREKKYEVHYKEIILPHHFYADFVMFNSIIVEIKAQKKGIIDEHYNQMINYLAVSKCKIGLLFNFGDDSMKYKRIIL